MTEAMLLLGRSRRDDAPIELPMSALLRHVMALGSSGSGKTVLCKVLVEEVVRQGLPALCIDPQGDLCSLALGASDPELLRERGVAPELAAAFAERADVVVFTPGSAVGVGLSVDPVNLATEGMSDAERMHAITRTAAILTGLLGYDPDSDDGTGLAAVLDHCLQALAARDEAGRGLAALSDYLHDLPPAQERVLSRYLDLRKLKTARQRLARLDVGARRLLFHHGAPIDIDMLLGRGRHAVPGKTRVAVVYLNTLHGQEDKDFFVATLVDQLYAWMLRNPSPQPQALFYIDEVAPFVPPVRKPAAKPGLQLLFKQARKYGVCCLMATQNPGDVDYKSMAQFGTWALGRLTTRQDLKKVEPTIKSLVPTSSDAVMEGLPALGPGCFELICPDCFEQPQPLAVRWLLTPHETLDEGRIEALADERWRERFAALVRGGEPSPTDDGGAEPEAVPDEPNALADGDALDDGDELAGGDEPDEPDEADGTSDGESGELAEPSTEPHDAASMPPVEETLPVRTGATAMVSPQVRTGDTLVAVPVSQITEPPTAFEPPTTFEPPTALEPPTAFEPPTTFETPTVPEPAPIDPVQARREALAPFERVLAQTKAMTLADLATRAGIGQTKARGVMASMIELGLARSYADGRKKMYWATRTGGRPDLGMPKQVTVARAPFDESAAWTRGHEMLRTKVLGLFGEDESLERVEAVHRLVLRLDFEEKVPRSLLQRVFGESHDLRLGSVYLHPTTLEVLVYTPDKGIRFVAEPREHASAVQDLDGAVDFDERPPGLLGLVDDDWRTKRSAAEAKARFAERFAAAPSRVSPVFVPLWRLVLRVGLGQGFRVVEIDGLCGRIVQWP
ncbi:MAG: DUF853 family protein [Myxococcales bacterium]|nr:DUF853 family protein [Myxococcales bacterium]MCB9716520.1 DUF853 family protein [Myxococcales bacterium]